jgi:hypothetical protein
MVYPVRFPSQALLEEVAVLADVVQQPGELRFCRSTEGAREGCCEICDVPQMIRKGLRRAHGVSTVCEEGRWSLFWTRVMSHHGGPPSLHASQWEPSVPTTSGSADDSLCALSASAV